MLAPEQAILGALAVPAVGAALIALSGRAPNLREGITLATAAALFGCNQLLCLGSKFFQFLICISEFME